MAILKFSANAKSENQTKTIVKAREFSIVIDEPPNLGGTDAGANPVEYVLAALAGCLNVVGHIVAKEMGFTLRALEIDLEGQLDPTKFMGKPTQGRAGYTEISVTLRPDTDANKDVLDQWAKAIELRCPVSDNLANATPIKIMLR